MKNTILEKLSRHFAELATREADVVYALVEVRKFLEQTAPNGRPGNLTFFCDWALHGLLDRRKAQKLLRMVDDFIGNQLKAGDSPLSSAQAERPCFEVFSLEGLRGELKKFCETLQLPTLWTTDRKDWLQVARLYASVIQDCALVVRAGDAPTAFINEVILTAAYVPDWAQKQQDGREYFTVNWELRMKNRSTVNIPCTMSDLSVSVAYPRHEFQKLAE
jgi:hypothetical protein